MDANKKGANRARRVSAASKKDAEPYGQGAPMAATNGASNVESGGQASGKASPSLSVPALPRADGGEVASVDALQYGSAQLGAFSQARNGESKKDYNRRKQAEFRDRQAELLRDRAYLRRALFSLQREVYASKVLPEEVKQKIIGADPLSVIVVLTNYISDQMPLPIEDD